MDYTKDYERHQHGLGRFQAEVQDLYRRKQGFRIFHGSTNSIRPAHQGCVVNTSCLNRILRINPNPDAWTVLVEPNVPMDRLVDDTLQVGLMPPVVRASRSENADLFHAAAWAAGTLGIITLLEL